MQEKKCIYIVQINKFCVVAAVSLFCGLFEFTNDFKHVDTVPVYKKSKKC